MGEHGVRHVMKSLLAEFDILMNVGGFKRVDDIDRSALGEKFETSGTGRCLLILLAESYPKNYQLLTEKSKL